MTKKDLSTKINIKIYYYKNIKNIKPLFPEGLLNYSRISAFREFLKLAPAKSKG
jgi:hypothetical protein